MRFIRSKSIRNRQGTIYVVTMSASLIVAVLVTTALMTARVQRLSAVDSNQVRRAQVYAESALELAQYRMRTSANWRSQLAANAWANDQPIADGFLRFTGRDPLDNDLTDSNYESVEIVATGKQGNCVHKLKGTIEFQQPGINCLGSGVHARDELIVDNATLTNLVAPSSSNVKITATNFAKLNSNCESASVVAVMNLAQVSGTTLQNQAQKQMPNGSNIYNYYLNQGTVISVGSLPLWDRNHLANPSAEDGLTSWTANNCTVTQRADFVHGGSYSFLVSGRAAIPAAFPSYVYQDVTAAIAGGVPYSLEAWIYVPGALNQDNFRIKLQINATGGNVAYTTAWLPSNYDTWTFITGSGSVNWSGTLQSAYWYVESQLLAAPYYLDDCRMKEAAAEPSTGVVHRALLSPQTNSLNGVTNSQGIYVIDCQGQTVNVRDSRIQGTLVLRNPNANSRIEGSVLCEPVIGNSTSPDTPNMLALVTEKKIKIALSSANLDERLANRNFNPAGTPYQEVVDSDMTDSYPSQINGIVYSLDDLLFAGTTTINGVVIGDKKIEVRGTDPLTTSLTIQHQALYRYVNPPLEFRDAPIISLKSGSVSRLVD